MENRFQTSFIPQKPPVPGGGEIYRPKSPPNFFVIFGFIVFLFILAIFGGLFFYKGTLTKSNEGKKQKISAEIKNFEPELTRELTLLKARIDSSKQLLANHVAASSLFLLLQDITAQTVRFRDMTFTVSEDSLSRERKVGVVLKGEAASYSSIAFQSDIFSRNENLKSPIFFDVNLNEQGFVEFNVRADVMQKAVTYKP